jgi:hypothetical protein
MSHFGIIQIIMMVGTCVIGFENILASWVGSSREEHLLEQHQGESVIGRVGLPNALTTHLCE